MKKLIILFISIILFYTFSGQKSTIKKKEIDDRSKIKITKTTKNTKYKKKNIINIKKNNNKYINKMMIHFFETRESQIKKRLSTGDFIKLKKIIIKVKKNKELNQRDILTYRYLENKNIIKSLQYNNLNFL